MNFNHCLTIPGLHAAVLEQIGTTGRTIEAIKAGLWRAHEMGQLSQSGDVVERAQHFAANLPPLPDIPAGPITFQYVSPFMQLDAVGTDVWAIEIRDGKAVKVAKDLGPMIKCPCCNKWFKAADGETKA